MVPEGETGILVDLWDEPRTRLDSDGTVGGDARGPHLAESL